MQKIFDYQKIIKNRDFIATTLHKNDYLLHHRAVKLLETINILRPQKKFDQILEINSYTGQLTTKLQKIAQKIHCVDFSQKMLSINQLNNPLIKIYKIFDEILPKFYTKFDIIADLSSLYFINDLPLLLLQIKQLLIKDGIFIGTALGISTLTELKTTMLNADLAIFNGMQQRIIPFCNMQNIGILMQNMQFKNVNIISENLQIEYNNLKEILADLRYIGNPLIQSEKKFPLNKQYWQIMNEKYPKNTKGKLPLTIEFLTIVGHL